MVQRDGDVVLGGGAICHTRDTDVLGGCLGCPFPTEKGMLEEVTIMLSLLLEVAQLATSPVSMCKPREVPGTSSSAVFPGSVIFDSSTDLSLCSSLQSVVETL